MKNSKNITQRFIPAIWGIIMFNVLRAATDLTNQVSGFWKGDIQLHFVGVLSSVVFCYAFDYIWRRRLNKPNATTKSKIKYSFVLIELLLSVNIALILGEKAGAFYMGEGWIDYVLINISYIPLLMLYYTLLRNNITNKKYQKELLAIEKLKAEKFETELKFLKSQYHPHFLFNALNTIYFQIDEKNESARQSVELLADLLRYQLYDIQKKVTLKQEISYLKSYIAFQRLRMSRKLILETFFDVELNGEIHPLLFQPLLENAFKYVGGEYRIKLELKRTENKIQLLIENSVSDSQSPDGRKDKGIGLKNLEKRLALLYPGKHLLKTGYSEENFLARLTIDTK